MSAYWIARVKVKNPQAFGEYAKRAGPAVTQNGGKFLARGGQYETVEGEDYPRNVVVEFASLDQALACYHSPEYQEARSFLKDSAEREIALVEGV